MCWMGVMGQQLRDMWKGGTGLCEDGLDLWNAMRCDVTRCRAETLMWDLDGFGTKAETERMETRRDKSRQGQGN